MRNSDAIKLGIYNACKKPIGTLITASSFITVFVLVFIASYYIGHVNNRISSIIENEISSAYVVCAPGEGVGLENAMSTLEKSGFSTQKQIRSRLESAFVLQDLCDAKPPFVPTLDLFCLTVDGKKYMGTNDRSFTFETDGKSTTRGEVGNADRNVYMGITIVGGDNPVVSTDNEEKELNRKFPNQKVILYGTDMKASNDVLLSDYILDKFGVTRKEMPGLIGKKIKLSYMQNNTSRIIIDDAVISGIIAENYFKIERERSTPQVFVSMNNPCFAGLDDFEEEIIIDAPSFKEIAQYEKKLNALGIGDVYCDEQTFTLYKNLEMEKEVMSFIFGTIVVVIGIALAVNIYSIQDYQIQRKKYYFGLMSAIGMSRMHLTRLLFAELCFVACISAIISIAISCVILYFISIYLQDVVGSAFLSDPIIFVIPTIVLLIASPAIAYIITKINDRRLSKDELITLLRS